MNDISVIWKFHQEEELPTLESSLNMAALSPKHVERIVVYDPQVADSMAHVDAEITSEISNPALTAARNEGVRLASSDVVAFLDADAVPDAGWVKHILEGMDHADMVGGPLVPQMEIWLAKAWHWLVGCGPYYDEQQMVPNTYGSNIAIRKSAFRDVGGFREDIGIGSDGPQQAGETELCRRLRKQGYEGVLYLPEATVTHHIPEERLEKTWLMARAYNQGKAKAMTGVSERENTFISDELLPEIRANPKSIPQSMLFVATVGLGYLHSKTSNNTHSKHEVAKENYE